MTNTGEAFGEDVEEPTSDEFVGMQGHHSRLACRAGGPFKEDVALLIIS